MSPQSLKADAFVSPFNDSFSVHRPCYRFMLSFCPCQCVYVKDKIPIPKCIIVTSVLADISLTYLRMQEILGYNPIHATLNTHGSN